MFFSFFLFFPLLSLESWRVCLSFATPRHALAAEATYNYWIIQRRGICLGSAAGGNKARHPRTLSCFACWVLVFDSWGARVVIYRPVSCSLLLSFAASFASEKVGGFIHFNMSWLSHSFYLGLFMTLDVGCIWRIIGGKKEKRDKYRPSLLNFFFTPLKSSKLDIMGCRMRMITGLFPLLSVTCTLVPFSVFLSSQCTTIIGTLDLRWR